jgi:hypothetical protein
LAISRAVDRTNDLGTEPLDGGRWWVGIRFSTFVRANTAQLKATDPVQYVRHELLVSTARKRVDRRNRL